MWRNSNSRFNIIYPFNYLIFGIAINQFMGLNVIYYVQNIAISIFYYFGFSIDCTRAVIVSLALVIDHSRLLMHHQQNDIAFLNKKFSFQIKFAVKAYI